MRAFLVTSLALISLLAGCGGSGSGSGSGSPPPSYPAIAGNWALAATSKVTNQTYEMGAYFSNFGSSVSGTLHILNSPCFGLTVDIPITGKITTAGVVSATSSAVSGQTITISGTVASDVLSSGEYNISGGCGNGDNGTVTGFIAPSYVNTYNGTFQSISGLNIGTAVTIKTQTGPDANGFYSVTGSATFTGSPCFTSGTISTSTITGAFMEIGITADDGSLVTFGGYMTNSTGDTISGEYEVNGGNCSGDSGTGSVSHS